MKKHGNSTWRQKITYLTLGSLFWISIMMISNYSSLERTRFKPSFGSACVVEYKKCIQSKIVQFGKCTRPLFNCGNPYSADYKYFRMPRLIQKQPVKKIIPETYSAKENKAIRNMCIFNAKTDHKLCEVFCEEDSRNIERFNECRHICLIASDLTKKEDCPLEINCPRGCPCPKFKCMKNVYQTETPMIIQTSKYRQRWTKFDL